VQVGLRVPNSIQTTLWLATHSAREAQSLIGLGWFAHKVSGNVVCAGTWST